MQYRRVIFYTEFFLILLALAIPSATSAQSLPIVNIGIIKDGSSPRFDNQAKIIKQEILEITKGEFNVRFPESSQLTGEWDLAVIRRSIDNLFDNNNIDLIIATGPVGSHEIVSRKFLSKPAISTIILDIALQDAPLVRGTSGVKNLNYLASPKSFERDLNAFLEIVKFKHLSILITDAIFQRLPQLQAKATAASSQYNIEFHLIPAGASASDALSQLKDETDAVMVTPLVKMSDTEFIKLAEGLKSRKLPSFSMHGRDEVDLGLFASLAPKNDVNRVGRRIAINVLSILTGEDAGSLSVGFSVGERLAINMETARAIDLYPNWDTLSEAERVNEQRKDGDRSLTLLLAVNEAITANLDLAVANQEVAVGKHNVSLARSQLLPQLDSSLSSNRRDAELSNVGTPERSGSGSFQLRQIIYSDAAWARLEISGKLQDALELERDSIRLDIILNASSTYLNILKAKTIEQIRKENVRRSRHNLELARVRESIGQSSRADVYRWETEIATDKQEALAAEAARLQTELNLNLLLNRPQDDLFTLEDTQLNDPLLLISDPRFFHLSKIKKNGSYFTTLWRNKA